jgi:hypothetical protein
MARRRRRRHNVSPDHIWLLKVLGFRYSSTRDAYVLRVVGRRFGPVYRVADTTDPVTSRDLNSAH